MFWKDERGKKKQILRLLGILQTLGKARFWARARVARKETDPWSPAAHHGIAPHTFGKPLEKHGFAASPRRRKRDWHRSHLRDVRNLTVIGKPSKPIGKRSKTSKSARPRKLRFLGKVPVSLLSTRWVARKNSPGFGGHGPAETSSFHVI